MFKQIHDKIYQLEHNENFQQFCSNSFFALNEFPNYLNKKLNKTNYVKFENFSNILNFQILHKNLSKKPLICSYLQLNG